MDAVTQKLTALVLAGERPGGSALAEAGGVSCKALLPVGGRAMGARVLEALSGTRTVSRILFLGPAEPAAADPALAGLLSRDGVGWIAPGPSPAASVAAALDGLRDPVLVTTADHALLTPAVVDHFVRAAAALDAGVVAGIARRDRVRASFPELKKTTYRLREGGFCGCNLFLMRPPEAQRAAEFWRQVERERKRPWRIARMIGWGFLLRYLSGRLGLEDATEHLGRRMGVAVATVELPFAEAAVDVDTVEDWRILERLLAEGRIRGEAPA